MTMTNMMSVTMMMTTTPLVFKPCRTHNTSSFQIRLTPLSECTLIIHLHVMSCLRRLMLIITMCLHVQMVTYVIGGFTSWHVVESSASRRTTIPAGWGHECKIPDVMIPGEQRLWSVALDFKSKNQSTSNNRHKTNVRCPNARFLSCLMQIYFQRMSPCCIVEVIASLQSSDLLNSRATDSTGLN